MRRIDEFVPRMSVSMCFLGLFLAAATKPLRSLCAATRPAERRNGHTTGPDLCGLRTRSIAVSRLVAFAMLVLAGLSVPAAAQQTIFGGNLVPGGEFTNAERQLGLRFKSDVPGQISSIRFYRSAANGCDTGAHMDYVYDLAGTVLASVDIPASDATGWQEQALAHAGAPLEGGQYVCVFFRLTDNTEKR